MEIMLSILYEMFIFVFLYITGAIAIKTLSLGTLEIESRAEYKARLEGRELGLFQFSWPSVYKREGRWAFDMEAVWLTGALFWVFAILALAVFG